MGRLTSKWDGSGIRTSPWRRESHADTAITRQGYIPVGSSGTLVAGGRDLLESERDNLCRFCVAMVHHECQRNSARPNGNGPPSVANTHGYTQRFVPHPTLPMRQVMVRYAKPAEAKVSASKVQRVARVMQGRSLL